MSNAKPMAAMRQMSHCVRLSFKGGGGHGSVEARLELGETHAA